MAREKKLALILSFEQTIDAMAVEKYCMNNNIPGRIIPVPREITAGCGLAWKTMPGEETNLVKNLEDAGLTWSGKYFLMLP